MEYYLEEMSEIIEEFDGEDVRWNIELIEKWSEEGDKEYEQKWGIDFSEL